MRARVRVCVCARTPASSVRKSVSREVLPTGKAGLARTAFHSRGSGAGERLRERIVQSPQVLPPGTSDGDDDSDVPRRATGRAKMLMRLSEKSPGPEKRCRLSFWEEDRTWYCPAEQCIKVSAYKWTWRLKATPLYVSFKRAVSWYQGRGTQIAF